MQKRVRIIRSMKGKIFHKKADRGRMYNRFLEKNLDNDPKKVLSKRSVQIRKVISPIIRFIVVTPNSKLVVLKREDIPKDPVIFAATHGFREDVEHTVIMANRQAYILNGSLKQVF